MIHQILTESSFQVMLQIDVDGEYAVTEDVDSITWAIHPLDNETPVATGSLDPLDVMYDSLQTDSRWTADDIGYNMLHELDHTLIADAGLYVVVYTVTCGATVFRQVTDQIRAKHPYND